MTNNEEEVLGLPIEDRRWPTNFGIDNGIYPTGKKYNLATKNIEKFWNEEAKHLDWYKSWDKVLEWKNPFAKWFVGGKINACYNAVDRHIKTHKKTKAAIIWEGEPGDTRVLTYLDLFREVNNFSSALKKLGIKKGDKIAICMPMIPEFQIAILSAARIGAVFTVIFSGFSANALAGRINDSQAKLVITTDGGYRRGKVIELKNIVDDAVKETPSVKNVIVYKRVGNDIKMVNKRDHWWDDLVKNEIAYVEPEQVESSHPLYILYTSGTTGKPKGVLHSTGGYLLYANRTTKWVFDVNDEDIYWCSADIGWVTGHTYIIFGPLSNGITSIMYEGAPDYPKKDRWWEIIEKYKVTILYTAPTAIRALMKFGDELPNKHDLNSLRILGTVGEPINPAAWEWYYNIIGGGRCPISDTWWQTETGGALISAAPNLRLFPLKPGSATYPLPGIEAEVVDEKGNVLENGRKGYIVIKKPWPGMFMGLYNDDVRYKEVYWSKFPGIYYPGDYAIKDNDGYFWLLGRADEVLNVAGHRLGTIEIEDVLVSHSSVAESAVAGRPDDIKGEAIVAFVTLKHGYEPTEELRQELAKHVKVELSSIAVPSELYFVNTLPKTRSGKIMRRIVKAIASGKTVGDITTIEEEASVDEIRAALDGLKKK